ncbi:hypothetical protein [Aquimarina litoralis]|uniref:hypothetical protein n=1 Tax=Aquimarina litoralis TaxID=584605 RepID=UPI001C55BC56|nr:hypothetical protein [Aquimarina litoralis]MBW1296660.1 hypothetical protein [Aquimarina litoralis]
MEAKLKLSKQWILFGAVSGIMSILIFPILLFIPFPTYIEIFLAGIFGILFSLIGIAIHHTMKYEKETIITQLGAIFILIAGIIFNLMLMIQQTFRGYLNSFINNTNNEQDQILLDWIRKTVDPVHLGLQISNDFFTGIAMILFSIAMFNHKYFGKVYGITGILIGVVLIIIKCYAFPLTPQEIGIPYFLAPLICLWFFAVCVQCLRVKSKL